MLGHLLATTLQDVRYGLRLLRRSPAFTITALLTLALTMGAVSTVMTLANAILLRPLAGERPRELVVLAKYGKNPVSWDRVSYLDYVHIRDHATTLSGLGAHCGAAAPWWVIYNGQSRELGYSIVSANYFSVLGLRPAIGRFFSAEEDSVPDRDRVAVISHDLWRQGWNAAPDVVGASIKIQGEMFSVVGVAPPGFHGLHSQVSDVYTPIMAMPAVGVGRNTYTDPDEGCLQMIGRIREGRRLEDVKAEAPALAPPRWQTLAAAGQPAKTLVAFRPRGAYSAQGEAGVDTFESGRVLAVVAGACLLLGCANLAALLLARGSSRARELAIRPSLGATPGRLLRQLMTESVLLAAVGGALGLLVSQILSRAFAAHFYGSSNGARELLDLRPDLRVIAGIALFTVGAAVLFGIMPALNSIQLGTALALHREAAGGITPSRLTRALIGAQVAGALALLTLVGLLLSSAQRFVADGRFEASHVALLRVSPTWRGPSMQQKYPPEKIAAFQQAVIDRLAAVPGVEAASVWNGGGVLHGAGQGQPRNVVVRRHPVTEPSDDGVSVGWKAIAPRYFTVLRTPLARGRDFTPADRVKPSRVAIVNEALARALWPDGDAIGSTLIVNKDAPAEVVGIVRDVYAPLAGNPSPPQVYVPLSPESGNRYCIRVQGDPAAALPTLVRALQELDPDVPVRETMTMDAYLAQRDLQPIRVTVAVTAYGAALAVLLGAIGIYGTLAFSVARRSKEIGVRIAVGAAPGDIVRSILHGEMRVVLPGVTSGLVLAWAASRFLRHLLYGLPSARDGALYAAAAMLVAGVALLACWLPARRAAGIDPMAALKSD
jgi:predicted permease